MAPSTLTCKGPLARRVWALDADLAAAFDRIDHARLLQAIGHFPAKRMVADWLKAGVFEPGKGFTPTEEGTPQGGVISPLLMNVALHGLKEAAGVRYVVNGAQAGDTKKDSPVLVRYGSQGLWDPDWATRGVPVTAHVPTSCLRVSAPAIVRSQPSYTQGWSSVDDLGCIAAVAEFRRTDRVGQGRYWKAWGLASIHRVTVG